MLGLNFKHRQLIKENKTNTFLSIIGMVLLVIYVPALLIWCANTLFNLNIPLTFKTWLAALLIAGVMTVQK